MKQRARTQEGKAFRRIQILDAAKKYFHEVGYEAFSMASLARLAGVAKGQATELLHILGVLLAGASSTDQGPPLDNEELPDDVKNLITSFSSQPLFIKNAVRCIKGIRTEAVSNT